MANSYVGRSTYNPDRLDTTIHDQFFQYYQKRSQSPETIVRFERLANLILKTMQNEGREGPFQIADIGGGAGTLSRTFARAGHDVVCVDICKDLLEEGKRRANEEGLALQFINCSATDTPIPDSSLDICIIPELLEHVVDWKGCLDEASRMLRPNGLLYVSTTNKLCPAQEEFTLPLYSWYPRFLKHYYERLAVTSRRELVNYAKYPAVHWFTFYSLQNALIGRRFSHFLDRLDMIEILDGGGAKATIAKWLRRIPMCRAAVQFVTNGTYILAFKSP